MKAWVAAMVAVLRAAPAIEWHRRRLGPKPLVDRLCQRRSRQPPRSAAERHALTKAIRLVDACLPGGANCYRRALLTLALDPLSPATLHIGLRDSAAPRSGHAWTGSTDAGDRYDAVFAVEPTAKDGDNA